MKTEIVVPVSISLAILFIWGVLNHSCNLKNVQIPSFQSFSSQGVNQFSTACFDEAKKYERQFLNIESMESSKQQKQYKDIKEATSYLEKIGCIRKIDEKTKVGEFEGTKFHVIDQNKNVIGDVILPSFDGKTNFCKKAAKSLKKRLKRILERGSAPKREEYENIQKASLDLQFAGCLRKLKDKPPKRGYALAKYEVLEYDKRVGKVTLPFLDGEVSATNLPESSSSSESSSNSEDETNCLEEANKVEEDFKAIKALSSQQLKQTKFETVKALTEKLMDGDCLIKGNDHSKFEGFAAAKYHVTNLDIVVGAVTLPNVKIQERKFKSDINCLEEARRIEGDFKSMNTLSPSDRTLQQLKQNRFEEVKRSTSTLMSNGCLKKEQLNERVEGFLGTKYKVIDKERKVVGDFLLPNVSGRTKGVQERDCKKDAEKLGKRLKKIFKSKSENLESEYGAVKKSTKELKDAGCLGKIKSKAKDSKNGYLTATYEVLKNGKQVGKVKLALLDGEIVPADGSDSDSSSSKNGKIKQSDCKSEAIKFEIDFKNINSHKTTEFRQRKYKDIKYSTAQLLKNKCLKKLDEPKNIETFEGTMYEVLEEGKVVHKVLLPVCDE